jgi:hypothetical protein
MFQGFSKNRQFNGFPRKGFGNGRTQWNGYMCDFWLDAGQSVDNPTNGGSVGAWVDSISGTTWISSGANRPIYRSSDAAFNNLPVIEGVTGTQNLQSAGQSILRTDQNFCIAIVAQLTTLFANGFIITPQTGGNGGISLGGTSAQKIGIYNANTQLLTSTTNFNTSPQIILISKSKLFINGNQEVLNGSQSTGLQSITTFQRIFGTSGSSTSAKIAEILFFPFDPTVTELNEISDLLNTKYLIY